MTVVKTDEGKVYSRDGKTFLPGSSNKGIIDAVSPNPDAKKLAEENE